MSDEVKNTKMIHLLPPWFDITLSINGHLEKYSLNSGMYAYMLEEEEIDPMNFVEVWIYITENLYEFLLPLTDQIGSIDPDRAKLVSLAVNVLAAPSEVEGAIDCNDCEDSYQDALDHATGEDDEDD